MKTFASVIGLAVLLGPAWVAADGGVNPNDVDRFVEAYRARNHIPGLAIAVTHDREILRVAGYGADSTGAPITASTLMPLGSLSKSFTSLAVMQLIEDGRVSLDAPIRTYLPDFGVADPRGDAITVRELLNHTSGLSDTTFSEKSGPLPGSLEDGVAMLRTAHLASEPGTKAHYHNPNYWVAARLVEVVSGQSFPQYLERHIFAPLGMRNTIAVTSLRHIPRLFSGHIRFFGLALAVPEPAWFLGGASGIVSTANDVARWLIVQNNGGLAAEGTRILSADGLEMLHDGLGWETRAGNGTRTVEHSGWLFTYTAYQLLVPDKGYGIAVMSNVGLGLAPVDSEVIAHALAGMIEGHSPSPGAPVSLLVDAALAGITLLVLFVSVRAFRGAREWRARRATASRWRRGLRLVAWLLPLAFTLSLPSLLAFVFGGRDASYLQMLYVMPTLVTCLVPMSAAALAVVVARVR